MARSPHQDTPSEKRARDRYYESSRWRTGAVDYPNIPQYDFAPTGQLTVTACGWPVRNWRDSKRTQIERRLGAIVAGIVSLAEEVRDREAQWARREAEHKHRVDRYVDEMTRRADELSAYRALRRDSKRWTAAAQLRSYIDAVEAAAIRQGTVSAELGTWLEWARAKANWIDPMVPVSDAVLDAPEPEKPGHSYR